MHAMQIPPWYVVTGGPCAGKTTLILELERRGYHVVHEPARLVIEEGLATGKTLDEIRAPSNNFAQKVLHRALAHEKNLARDATVFLDRGIVDSVGYYRHLGIPLDDELMQAALTAQYRKIFLLDLVQFEQDEARNETPEEAYAIHNALHEAYASYGFDIIRVPVVPVEERADMIVASIATA